MEDIALGASGHSALSAFFDGVQQGFEVQKPHEEEPEALYG